MRTPPYFPVALTIAGSDSGGGAGIQADLRAFRAFHVHGCSAITALTAQNPHGVRRIQATDPAVLRDQLLCVAEDFAVSAIKTGMLMDAERIQVVADCLPAFGAVPRVIDPVMVATSGATLLAADAVESLITRILPGAALVTPNLPESNVLLGLPATHPITEPMTHCRAIFERHHVPILLKGGHNPDQTATDFLMDADGSLWEIRSPIVAQPLTTHGTGCSLSAAVAANLARGIPLLEAICQAKAWVYALLTAGVQAGNAAVYGIESPEPPRHLVTCRALSSR